MANPFDQFDQASSGNPFDQFDERKTDQRVQAQNWSDVPIAALKNAPASAMEFGKNLVEPFLHPIQTAENIGALGKGLYSKAEGAMGYEQNPEQKAQVETPANAVGDFFTQRYGGLDNLKKTMSEDPIGFLGDAATVLTGGELAVGRVPGVIGQTARAAGTVGGAIDPLTNAVRAAGVGGKLAAKSLGLTTGVGGEAIEQAFKAGQGGKTAFLEQMRGEGDASNLVDMAIKKAEDLHSAATADYLKNTTELRAGGGAAKLSMTPVDKVFSNAESVFKQGNFVKNEAAQAAHEKIGSVIDEWKTANPKPTPMDYDALKQRIGEIDVAPGSAAEAVRTQVYNSIQKQLSIHVPEYAKAMTGYSDALKELRDFRKTFSLGKNVSTDTASRKILSILRDNVNTNYGQRRALGQQIADANPDFLPAVAGQTMRSWEPRGIARVVAGEGLLHLLGNPAGIPGAAAYLAASSPRLVGESAYKIGQAANMMPSPTTLNLMQQIGRIDRNQFPGLLGQQP